MVKIILLIMSKYFCFIIVSSSFIIALTNKCFYFSIKLNDLPSVDDLGLFVDDTVIFQCLKNLIVQVTNFWWDNDQDSVDTFRLFIALSISIHIVNILKNKDDLYISNMPALKFE
jgi:hypothetical protein